VDGWLAHLEWLEGRPPKPLWWSDYALPLLVSAACKHPPGNTTACPCGWEAFAIPCHHQVFDHVLRLGQIGFFGSIGFPLIELDDCCGISIDLPSLRDSELGDSEDSEGKELQSTAMLSTETQKLPRPHPSHLESVRLDSSSQAMPSNAHPECP
jgi:hypothetical protein